MRRDHHAQLDGRAGSHTTGLIERGDHAIQGIVLAKKENVVFAPEVVVKICRRKGSGCGNVAHAGIRKSAHAKFSSRGAQDVQAPRKIASLEVAVSFTRSAVN